VRGAFGRQPAAKFVADVYDRHGARLTLFVRQEQTPFSAIVVLDIKVKVEMIAREIGEQHGGELDSLRAIKRQSVR